MQSKLSEAIDARAQPGRKFLVHAPKRNPRQEYRLKQRQQIEASPFLAEKFPRLKSLKLTLEYYDQPRNTRSGVMKCIMNVEHARSALWFACPAGECCGGDFDLTEVLAGAVAARKKVATGELRCQGKRKRGDRSLVPCQTLLRYSLTLNYE